MTGDFFLSLLTPTITGVFAVVFFVLWGRRWTHPHLLLIAVTFLTCALAFTVQGAFLSTENPALRFLVNGLFLASVLGLCASALLRLKISIPIRVFGAISISGMGLLLFFLIVQPSLMARIVAMNGAFFLLTAITWVLLLRAKPRTRADWLVLAVASVGVLISVVRPVLASLALSSSNADVGQVIYWPALHGVTIFMAIAVALAFLATTATEVVEGLRADAQRDKLSGLLNRAGFDEHVQTMLARQKRGLLPVSLMLADLDDFKAINDTYGHPVGDRVIAEVGRILREHAGADVVGRVGGEEFALFYSDARRGDVSRRAEQLLLELHKIRVSGLPPQSRVTMSIGIYTHLGAVSLSELMVAADTALYDAKRGGKDCIVLAPLRLHSALRDPSLLTTYAASA